MTHLLLGKKRDENKKYLNATPRIRLPRGGQSYGRRGDAVVVVVPSLLSSCRLEPNRDDLDDVVVVVVVVVPAPVDDFDDDDDSVTSFSAQYVVEIKTVVVCVVNVNRRLPLPRVQREWDLDTDVLQYSHLLYAHSGVDDNIR